LGVFERARSKILAPPSLRYRSSFLRRSFYVSIKVRIAPVKDIGEWDYDYEKSQNFVSQEAHAIISA
jgi:hypothetical protein